MRILFHSNAGHVPTGYGQQTDLFTRIMAAEGHEVNVSAFYGLQGARVKIAPNLTVYPAGSGEYGQDILLTYAEQLKPDIVIGLMDLWVIEQAVLEKTGFVSWCPVDHYPVPPAVIERLPYTRATWAMSKFGHRAMNHVGYTNAWYVPHGIDTEVFRPIDRAEAREKLDLPADAFVVTCTAANKGVPSRKHLPQLLKAWSEFARKHSDAILILHSDPRPKMHGYSLAEICKFYRIPDANIRMPDYYGLDAGLYTPASLNLMYNAGDVFLLPSAGEGFGIPAVEAQAAGSPVILTDFSAQTELAGSGWLLKVDRMDWELTTQGSEQAHVSPSVILRGLEMAYDKRGDETLRTEARTFALRYDVKRVWERYMKPALLGIVEAETDAQRTEKRKAFRAAADAVPCECRDGYGGFCNSDCAYAAYADEQRAAVEMVE